MDWKRFEVPYVLPDQVRSPKAHWQLIDVLLDEGEGRCAYALGEWDGERRIGFRWNGTEENPLGNPQSRGLATWTMLDPNLHDVVLRILPKEKQSLARRFLGLSVRFEGVSLSDDRSSVLLWDFRNIPMVIVAKVDCAIIRDAVKNPAISDDDCRLLADRNQDLLAEIADVMLSDNRYKDQDNMRFIELGAPELERIASRFSTSVLDMAAQARWVR